MSNKLIQRNISKSYKQALKNKNFIDSLEGISDTNAILYYLSIVGVVSLSVFAPNILQFLKFTNPSRFDKPKPDAIKILRRRLSYLKSSGRIKIEKESGELYIKVLQLNDRRKTVSPSEIISIPKSSKWNNRWWIVAADIPTKSHRAAADAFRRKMKELLFFPLQKTLWIYPHEPIKELQFLVDHFKIGQFVTIFEVSRLDSDDKAKLIDFYKRNNILK